MMTATYSPEDNKLRLYSLSRLSRDLFDRVKVAGFKWAPKQELFVAPMWTPDREDLLIELCGEIGDEDTSLVDRAEQRAERFEDYGEKRFQDAERAHATVHAIADGIPLGQPILVGHHSERHARRDAEKIERGMRRALKMWETSKYWEARARGAISHAKYKELPAVRYRRIKTIEANKRKAEKECAETLAFMKAFRAVCPITWERAKRIANDGRLHFYRCYSLAEYPRNPPASQYEGEMSIWSALGDTPEEAIISPAWARLAVGRRAVRIVRRHRRWIRHYENRLAYERAMLGEQGGTAAERFELQPGGQILAEGLWLTIVRVNKAGGVVSSVSTNNRSWPRVVSVERIRDYRPPTEELAGKVKAATTLAPICNYPGEGFYPITQAQWDAVGRDYKRTANLKATETTAAHRVRVMDNFRLRSFGHVIKDQWGSSPVHITDAKRKDPPAMAGEKPACKSYLPIEHDMATLEGRAARRQAAWEVEAEKAAEAAPFIQMKESLRSGGVKVIAAPQLFPTPAALARRVIELADIQPGMTVLEPSAGTGALVRAIPAGAYVVAVELVTNLARALEYMAPDVRCGDFLAMNGELGSFDRIVMNPPFDHGADIRHIEHARTKLKPGGRLVAICAAGPRQRERFATAASAWIDLPRSSFAEQGTEVNAAIVVLAS